MTGFFVGTGQLALPIALAAATLGAVGNAVIVYALARWGARRVLLSARPLRLDERKLDRIEQGFARQGSRMVVLGRMMSVVRWLVGIPAGAGRMPLRVYVPLTTVGCLGWNSLLIGAGVILGRNYEKAGHMALLGTIALLVVGIAAVLAGTVRRRRPARRDANAGL
jgi:membrane protein DedA with SNARE-associated domain